MNFEKIYIVPKISKYEYDLLSLMLTHDELLELYEREGINAKTILDSHRRQKEIQKRFEEEFPDRVIFRNYFTREHAKKADLIIALGGDNHFIFLSHFVGSAPILGINSDPVKSEGALLNADSTQFDKILDALRTDRFSVEKWTRLQVEINDRKISRLAASEVFIGNKHRMRMSHYRICHKGYDEKQKCSGLVISTGAGSTGWYDSASRYLFNDGNVFPRTNRIARFIATEPYRGKLSGNKLLNGELSGDDVLEITSAHREGGIISIDGESFHDFGRDKVVKISISDVPLNVVNLDFGSGKK